MDPIELLDKVNAFYDQAFNRLLATMGILAAVIGVAVPLAIDRLQRKQLRIREAELKESLKSEIHEEYKILIDQESRNIKRESYNALTMARNAEGHAFMAQGRTIDALTAFNRGIYAATKSESIDNVRLMIEKFKGVIEIVDNMDEEEENKALMSKVLMEIRYTYTFIEGLKQSEIPELALSGTELETYLSIVFDDE